MSTNQTNEAGERHEFVGGSPPTFPDLCEFLGGEDVCQLPRSAPVHKTSKQPPPMSRVDYLLSHLAQECCEIAVRCTKAQMFGLDEIQPGQEFTNRQRIMHELCDLMALGETMRDEGILPDDAMRYPEVNQRIEDKKIKAATFSDYSRQLGRLEPL